MKPGKRNETIFSPLFIVVSSMVCNFIVLFAWYKVGGSFQIGYVLTMEILFVAWTVVLMCAGTQTYLFCENYVRLSTLGFKRKEMYDDYTFAVISNATRGINKCTDIYEEIRKSPLLKLRGKDGSTYVPPYISFHNDRFSLKNIKKNATSYEISVVAADYDSLMVGICRENAFDYLLKMTELPIFILEDVYLRFQDAFDRDIQSNNAEQRIFIVSDRNVSYTGYKTEN